VFVANPRFPARSLGDIARLSRAEARGVDMASSGSGSSNHLLIVQFGQVADARVNHVPYRGAGPAMTDVIAGVVPLMSDSLPSAAGHIRSGTVRAVAMASAERHPAFPDVPTFREQGVDLVSDSWFGLSGPQGLQAAVVQRLSEATLAVLAEPATLARFTELGGTPGRLSPAGYTDFVRAEVARWAPVVRASGAEVG
jgi:tripartite-type tricarboxylate transporter receptor subunit TctC